MMWILMIMIAMPDGRGLEVEHGEHASLDACRAAMARVLTDLGWPAERARCEGKGGAITEPGK